MKFGAHLPTYWNDYGASNMQTAVVEAAKTAEALGYDAVWANDFVVGPASDLRVSMPVILPNRS